MSLSSLKATGGKEGGGKPSPTRGTFADGARTIFSPQEVSETLSAAQVALLFLQDDLDVSWPGGLRCPPAGRCKTGQSTVGGGWRLLLLEGGALDNSWLHHESFLRSQWFVHLNLTRLLEILPTWGQLRHVCPWLAVRFLARFLIIFYFWTSGFQGCSNQVFADTLACCSLYKLPFISEILPKMFWMTFL